MAEQRAEAARQAAGLSGATSGLSVALKAMQDAAKGDDDLSLALSALIEGEATLTMMGAQMDDYQGQAIAKPSVA